MPAAAGDRLRLEGELSLREAGDLVARLRERMARGPMVVETDRLVSADASILQALVSAHLSARALGVSLRVEAPSGGVLSSALARSGISGSVDLPLAWEGGAWTGFASAEGGR